MLQKHNPTFGENAKTGRRVWERDPLSFQILLTNQPLIVIMAEGISVCNMDIYTTKEMEG